MNSKIFILASLALLFSYGDKNPLECPSFKSTDNVIRHTAYIVSYNTQHKQANWVAYHLDKENLLIKVPRKGSFKKDPDFGKTAGNEDYKGSGYDKGHLFPASDSWSSAIMKESFYFTNIAPQDQSFNRGIWKALETLEKEWGMNYGTVYVTTGPVLTAFKGKIGHGVDVPVSFYKVILDYTLPGYKGIGFILKNEAGNTMNLAAHAITIDSVEKVTGIDFFPGLPDKDEATIESHVDVKQWTWK